MKKDLGISELNDIYGKLLTKHQSDMLRNYYDFDLSLAEIAENEGVSRQAVHDSLVKAEEQLRHYEEQLGIKRGKERALELLRRLTKAIADGDARGAQTLVNELENGILE